MFYYMPVKVYAENGCVKNHASELAAWGKKALIVTGRHSAEACGALGDVKQALDSKNAAYVHFNEVEENPSVETIMKAREFGLKEQVDFVIGIGGGSPMDAAKAIALMLKHNDADASYLYDGSADSSALPIVEIPTTCGTGSEVTAVSILTRHDTHSKGSIPHKIFGNLALLDARYLKTASPATLASTAVDALAHLVESYISSDATKFSRSISLTGLKTWAPCKDVLLGKKETCSEALTQMLIASTYGGMAIAHTGTSLPHALSYTLTYNLHMKHGKACGHFLGGYMREAMNAGCTADVKTVLEAADFSSIEDYEKFYDTVCHKEAVDTDMLKQAVKSVLVNPAKIRKAPFHVDESVLDRIAGI